MDRQTAIDKGWEIVATHTERIFTAGHCAHVIGQLLPLAMLLAEAAEHAKKQGCVLAYCREAGIFAAVTEPLLDGWVRVWVNDDQEIK